MIAAERVNQTTRREGGLSLNRERLTIVSDTLPPDRNGIALIAFITAQILAKQQAVHLVGPVGVAPPSGVTHSAVPRLPIGTGDIQLPRPALRCVREAVSSADGVVVHTLGPLGVAALYYAKRRGTPVTLFMHNDYPRLLRHGLPRNPVVPAMGWLAVRLERWARGVARRVVSPCGVPGDGSEVLRLAPPAFPIDVGHRSDDGLTVAYHGRVSREKALDATVRSIHAADRGRRLQFRIVGDGSQLSSVLRLASELDVETHHVPWREEPRPALADADIYVTASRTETFSMTTLEAMGCGLPVIARRIGQIPAYIQHGVNGLLFDSDAELTELLAELARDPAKRARLAAGARASSIERTLWDQFADASIGCTSATLA